MTNALHGKTALVTGGLGDLGAAMARHLASAGAAVILWDLAAVAQAQAALENLRTANPEGRHLYQQVDVRDRAQVDTAVEQIGAQSGGVDIACVNAGIVRAQPFLDLTIENWQDHLDINLTGAFHTAQAVARQMVARNNRGKIIFTTSWVGSIPWPEITAYTVSKAGLNMLMKQMARELAVYGIRVNAIAPGIVKAGLAGRQLREEPQYAARVARVIPLGDPGTPEEIGQAVVYLASSAADYMTGSILTIDGGCSLFQFDR